MKRFIAFLLFLLCLTSLSVSAFAAEPFVASGMCGENAYWELTGSGILYIRGYGEMADYMYDAVNGEGTQPWYAYENNIKNVVIEDGITYIGASAFYAYYDLVSVSIPDSVTSIGESAFYECIDLTGVRIPDSVKTIGDWAFEDCISLANVTIPNSVTSIEGHSFAGTPWLSGKKDEFVIVGDGILLKYNGTASNVSIPKGVKIISGAFQYCSNLESVTIPRGVTRIGSSAFNECSHLQSVSIPNSVRSIGPSAFRYCSNLKEIRIPSSVTAIESMAFIGSHLGEITIPNSVASIGELAFSQCHNLTSADIPGSVASIGEDAFIDTPWLENQKAEFVAAGDGVLLKYNGANANVVIPKGIKYISSAFAECKNLTSVMIPDSVKVIGNGAFRDCENLRSVTIPDSVTSIGGSAFWFCQSLTGVTIPVNVKSIGDWAFYCCTNLTDVTLPGGIARIGNRAFANCENLMNIYYFGTKAQWDRISFGTATWEKVSGMVYCQM